MMVDRAGVYLRVSTSEQNEETQKKDCLTYCKNHNFEIDESNIHQERVSAFKKDVKRIERDKIIEKARLGEINHIVVWAYDRWIRDRDTLLEDLDMLLRYGCKIHSVKDNWLESINIGGPLGKTIREFMIGLIGSLAQMESERKSERIWLGKQKSTKKQGRKNKNFNYDLIKELINQGLSSYKVAEEYNKIHRPHISHMTVYNFIKKLRDEKANDTSINSLGDEKI